MAEYYIICPRCNSKLAVISEEELRYVRDYVREHEHASILGKWIRQLPIFKCRYCDGDVDLMRKDILIRKD